MSAFNRIPSLHFFHNITRILMLLHSNYLITPTPVRYSSYLDGMASLKKRLYCCRGVNVLVIRNE